MSMDSKLQADLSVLSHDLSATGGRTAPIFLSPALAYLQRRDCKIFTDLQQISQTHTNMVPNVVFVEEVGSTKTVKRQLGAD